MIMVACGRGSKGLTTGYARRTTPQEFEVGFAPDRYSRAMTLFTARGFEMVVDLASTQCMVLPK